jgi:hypothetical protein
MKKFFEMVASMIGLYGAMLKKEERLVKEVLANLDKSDPKKRPVNVWDKKFWELVPILYKYEEALEFLDTYGHVCDTYFKVLSFEDSQNIVFQLTLCEVVDTCSGGKRCRYPNLLHGFLLNWDFRDEVKKTIKNDPDKDPVVRFYNAHVNLWAKDRKLL